MSRYLYRHNGTRYEIVKVTPKLVFYRSSANTLRTVPRGEIKSGGTASLRFAWYLQPPSWPTEGELGEMYAKLRELEKAQTAAHKAREEARLRTWEMRERIDKYECEQAVEWEGEWA